MADYSTLAESLAEAAVAADGVEPRVSEQPPDTRRTLSAEQSKQREAILCTLYCLALFRAYNVDSSLLKSAINKLTLSRGQTHAQSFFDTVSAHARSQFVYVGNV